MEWTDDVDRCRLSWNHVAFTEAHGQLLRLIPQATSWQIAEAMNGRAGQCIEAIENGELVGVLILDVINTDRGRMMEVWAAAFKPGRSRINEIKSFVEVAAKQAGCCGVRFETGRATAFARLVKDYSAVSTTYEKLI
ncbi:hypothetical protein KS4_16130 [Poriferisphaera corsica]|uniref:Uncharacterized protein n=1 Tax=Poriferisphaera corsica TaxID=2528020 RepID=A0A517YTQ6_9BACT|nr:hypothetical protein [Poriferisphaera corsica]QDU33562.1 hypothetical protein KS4_16130 [Poriferisphaera corsica]